MAVATGTTINEDITSAPTVLAEIDIVAAVRSINIKLITFTLIPASLADSSSKVM